MKNPPLLKISLACTLLFFAFKGIAQPANNTCATRTNLGTLTGNYSATPGNLYLAGQTSPTGSSCGNRYDVWYQFTLPTGSTGVVITVVLDLPNTGTGSLTTGNTYIELFNTSNCTVNGTSTGGCNNITQSRKYTTLTSGGTYTLRINTSQNPNVLTQPYYGFNLFVVPYNDECNNLATILPAGTTIDGNLSGATNSAVAVTPCTGVADDDLWYRFTAIYSYATLTLSNIGSDFATAGSRMQLFSGTCASLTSLACSNTTNVINSTGLTPGNTYYVRVYSAASNPQTGPNWSFRISLTPSATVVVGSGRMKEIYHQQIISAPQILADPWEVTYGPDNNLWITESKGYRIYKMNPTTGVRDTVLDISKNSTFFSAPADQAFNCQFNNGTGAQGGLAGLALHPKFLDATAPQNFVYVSYVRDSANVSYFTNRLVRFTYNTGTGKLESPVSLCDTLPGSNDHNSQRMIIAPVTIGGTKYLFYASGDMGAGQGNATNIPRVIKAQFPNSYEGKILRFNLTPDPSENAYDQWIPNDNPYNAMLGVQSAVWNIGQRNNQGFAYDSTLNVLYGSSHGPYSDDEINIMEGFKNYGHPLVIGYVADGNYNGTTTPGLNTSISAGAPFWTGSGISSNPPIGSEATRRAEIDASGNGLYKDPLFSAYPGPISGPGSVAAIWGSATSVNNSTWPSEGWSGLDLYTNTFVPGWKGSLVAASLKWGRLVRFKLNNLGTSITPTDGQDTVSYFGSKNRFRDLAFSPNGKDIYVIMDRNTTTSGPSALFPVVPSCQGCVQKYTFLGYADAAGKSSIPTAIDVTSGTLNACENGTTVVIDNTNNNLWVPITGTDGNIMAEIFANGQNLGTVTSSFYKNSGAIRFKSGSRYLDRNITINPQNQPASPVKVRLYLSKAEFDALDADPLSGISTIGDLKILKNNDPCSNTALATTTLINPTFSETHGSNGFMLQANISSFSSFYFGNTSITLPVQLLTFTGTLQTNSTVLLKWKTQNEVNTEHFTVERSVDGIAFTNIGLVPATGTTTGAVSNYSLTDVDAKHQQSLVLFYRLRITDTDGTIKYSTVITIYLSDITGKVSINPNPVNDLATVNIKSISAGNVNLMLLDNTGRVLMQTVKTVQQGDNKIVLNTEKIATGVYYVRVSGVGINEQIRLLKVK